MSSLRGSCNMCKNELWQPSSALSRKARRLEKRLQEVLAGATKAVENAKADAKKASNVLLPAPQVASVSPAAPQVASTSAVVPNKRRQRRQRMRAQKAAATKQEATKQEEAGAPKQEDSCSFVADAKLPVLDTKATAHMPHTQKSSSAEVSECPLASCSYQVLVGCVVPFLDSASVYALAQTSHKFKTIASEGTFWRDVFQRTYKLSELSPGSLQEWKTAFLIERKQVAKTRFSCFVTKQSFFGDVMGLPITYTMNPKTGRVDYILAHAVLLSESAFEKGTRFTPSNESFSLVLPLFFSQVHFARALPAIERCLVKLSPEFHTRKFNPLMVLEVLPKIMNTFIVLLADKGVAASQASFQGYVWIHRLFIELVREYGLDTEVERRLTQFVAAEKNRSKQTLPSLGNFLPLLSVSEKFQWRDVAPAYLQESMDRSVLWIAKAHPDYVSIDRKFDALRPDWAFDGAKVSLRLCLIHVLFLRRFCQGSSLVVMADRYDQFFGGLNETEGEDKKNKSASSPLVPLSRLQSEAKAILEIDSWPKYYYMAGFKCPKKSSFIAMSRSAVQRSMQKRYHERGMDFSRVHASGTSSILNKGESYQIKNSMAMKNLCFTDRWEFKGHTKFLDCSILTYSADKKLLHRVDFRHNHAPGITHSGDQIGFETGLHVVKIELANLARDVQTLVFVLSAYRSALLTDILQPVVSFEDETSGAMLCEYKHHMQNTGKLKAIVMCKLERTADAGWRVQAIGELSNGDASNYGPIQATVAAIL
eukprot:gb/GEZN01001970.1/.p1 GENE.gb/GEZN01001970.1/~~gb/GEZN01001970.1/.p1  ORF type:complete len:764 (+),score=103.04 gb/GEZN01001970.1/:57-2348(+)